MVSLLYADVRCPACRSTHTLRLPGLTSLGRRAHLRYTCPTSRVIVVYRPRKAPQACAEVPPEAIPATPLPDSGPT